jgi:hypothetical protein
LWITGATNAPNWVNLWSISDCPDRPTRGPLEELPCLQRFTPPVVGPIRTRRQGCVDPVATDLHPR